MRMERPCAASDSSSLLLFAVVLLVCSSSTTFAWRFPSWLASAHASSAAANDSSNEDNGSNNNDNHKATKSWWQDANLEAHAHTTSTTGNDSTSHALSRWQLEPLLQIPCGIAILPADRTMEQLLQQHALVELEHDNNDSDNDSDGDEDRGPHFHAVTTMLDTGAQRSILTMTACQRLGLVRLLDRRYAGGTATSVVGGECHVAGRIPANTVVLRVTNVETGEQVWLPLPAITVLQGNGDDRDDDQSPEEEQHVELLLGLDILRELKATIDLEQEEVRWKVNDKQHYHSNSVKHLNYQPLVRIPFIRPRTKLPSLEEIMVDQEDDDMDGGACQDDNDHHHHHSHSHIQQGIVQDDDQHINDIHDIDTRPHIIPTIIRQQQKRTFAENNAKDTHSDNKNDDIEEEDQESGPEDNNENMDMSGM